MTSTTHQRIRTSTGRVHFTAHQGAAFLLESERTGRIAAVCGLTVIMGKWSFTPDSVSCARCARFYGIDVKPVSLRSVSAEAAAHAEILQNLRVADANHRRAETQNAQALADQLADDQSLTLLAFHGNSDARDVVEYVIRADAHPDANPTTERTHARIADGRGYVTVCGMVIGAHWVARSTVVDPCHECFPPHTNAGDCCTGEGPHHTAPIPDDTWCHVCGVHNQHGQHARTCSTAASGLLPAPAVVFTDDTVQRVSLPDGRRVLTAVGD